MASWRREKAAQDEAAMLVADDGGGGAAAATAEAAPEESIVLRLVDQLLLAGADPDAADSNDVRPLWIAAHQGHAQAVERLLRAGAQVDAAALDGTTCSTSSSKISMADRRSSEPPSLASLASLASPPPLRRGICATEGRGEGGDEDVGEVGGDGVRAEVAWGVEAMATTTEAMRAAQAVARSWVSRRMRWGRPRTRGACGCNLSTLRSGGTGAIGTTGAERGTEIISTAFLGGVPGCSIGSIGGKAFGTVADSAVEVRGAEPRCGTTPSALLLVVAPFSSAWSQGGCPSDSRIVREVIMQRSREAALLLLSNHHHTSGIC